MAELDLIAPGPLTGVTVHPLAPLGPDPEAVILVEKEDAGPLSKPDDKTQEQGPDSAPGEEEGQILCDFCLGASRVRAVKSCLTCMVNYCEEHLRPHQENSKLHSHQLTEPAKDQDLRTCPAHHSPLVSFCHTHQQCICQECGEGEHRGDSTVSLDAARKNKEVSDGVCPHERGQWEVVSPRERSHMLAFVALLMPVCSESIDKNFSHSAWVLIWCEYL